MWTWLLGGLVVWVLLAVGLGIVLGRSIRLADLDSPGTGVDRPLTTEASTRRASTAAPAVTRRRVPWPPVAVGLAALAVALETAGLVLRSTGGTGSAARLLSMDAPYSLPRLYVAALFGAAAIAAIAAAGRIRARRTWWLAVGSVAAGIAVVKAGSTVHADAVAAVAARVGDGAAFVLGAVVAAGVLGVLAFLTRTERRDRRRVLSALALYAGASVGLSALSSVAGDWSATATFLEESGEALAGVSFLVAVLVGVAPRLVLPADTALRRRSDAETLDAPGAVLPVHRSSVPGR